MMFHRMTLVAIGVAVLLASGGATTGCKSKKQEQARQGQPSVKSLTGLQAIPRDVSAIIAMDVTALQRSWLVRRAVEQMYARDRALEARIDALIISCEIDLAGGIRQIIIGLGEHSGSERGTEEAVMVVTGEFVEAKLASCIGQSVAGDGRSLIADKVAGRTLYGIIGDAGVADQKTDAQKTDAPATPASGTQAIEPTPPAPPEPASDDRSDIWFTVSGPSTLVVATSKDWLLHAVGDGAKVMQSPVMAKLIDRADRSADVWAVGQVDPGIGNGLVQQSSGAITAPPKSISGSLDLQAGLKLGIVVEMSNSKDANALKSLIGGNLGLIALAAQGYGMGEWSEKLRVDSKDETMYLRLALTEDEVRQVLSSIDTSAGSAQNPADNRGEP